MSQANRRAFLQQSGAGVAGAVALNWTATSQAASSNETFRLALIGAGGRGHGVSQSFAKYKDVEFLYVADPDIGRAKRTAAAIDGICGKAPRAVQDFRIALDDDAVDAVIVATPDHWHGPATLLALEAGKHVYVEKPCAHNIREGRLMVEAARRHKRVVQVGTQSRSSPPIMEAMQMLRDGAIGDVLIAKAWNSQRRANIGHARPTIPPDGLDYETWVGPAPFVPFQPNRAHYTWHWWYDFGTGDFGNDGVHDADIARWGLGVEEHPQSVAVAGGKYYFDDDQQFADTIYAAYEYPGDGKVGHRRQLIFEQRIWTPYRQEGYENGNAFYGTNGMLLLGKNDGWKLFGPRNKLIKSSPPGGMGEPHFRNFLDCIANGKKPNADIEIGHLSAALCHLGNIAVRVGRSLKFDPATEQILDDENAAPLVRREYRKGHWAVPKVLKG